jgi:hypothetical protein
VVSVVAPAKVSLRGGCGYSSDGTDTKITPVHPDREDDDALVECFVALALCNTVQVCVTQA